MMKKFLTSMLGSIAGFWISLIILGVTFFVFIFVVAGGSSSSNVSLSDKGILHLKLSGSIIEREQPIKSLIDLQNYSEDAISYSDIIKAISAAKDDNNINGIFVECIGADLGVASCQEINEALVKFKESGKWVYAYADNYNQNEYFIATASDSIFINPVGVIGIHGLSATTLFYKGLMDKIGVEAQIVKVGTYKSAVEPFILTQMSDASREQQEQYLGNIWKSISDNIAKSRKATSQDVNMWADSLIITKSAKFYKTNKLVDNLLYRHQVEEIMLQKLNVNDDQKLNLITPKEYNSLKNSFDITTTKDHIAILYATGDIVDNGEGGIVGSKMAPEILELAKNDKVKGLILRVNSGGGSAFASEQIWEALEQFKKTGKPFYVSMGDVAASGGYYISCGADKIFALPTTLTGSIGIFGVIMNLKQLVNNHLGVTADNVSTNQNGDFPSFINPMTDTQKNLLQKHVESGYELFVKRCADGRNTTPDKIKEIGEGRVWDGTTAKKIGLIDSFGGLETAIAEMEKETGITNMVEYPLYEATILNQLISSGNLSNAKIPSEVEELNEYFKLINRIKSMSTIQCKMEDIIIK